MEQELFIELNQEFTDRSVAEFALSEMRIKVNELWQPLFTQRAHRMLARQFLLGEIALMDVEQAFIELPKPSFTGSSNTEHY